MGSPVNQSQKAACLLAEQVALGVSDGHRSPDFYRLGEHLEMLMAIVPDSGKGLERTTLLTWLYRRNGVMQFLELCELCELVSKNISIRKRNVRRVLRGMYRIGAINVLTPTDKLDTEVPLRDSVVPINRFSTIVIATGGMIWLHRAWQARAATMRKQTSQITAIHDAYLREEEEDCRSGDPYWLQKFVIGEERYAHGAHTAWVGPGVNSVFALSRAMNKTALNRQT